MIIKRWNYAIDNRLYVTWNIKLRNIYEFERDEYHSSYCLCNLCHTANWGRSDCARIVSAAQLTHDSVHFCNIIGSLSLLFNWPCLWDGSISKILVILIVSCICHRFRVQSWLLEQSSWCRYRMETMGLVKASDPSPESNQGTTYAFHRWQIVACYSQHHSIFQSNTPFQCIYLRVRWAHWHPNLWNSIWNHQPNWNNWNRLVCLQSRPR